MQHPEISLLFMKIASLANYKGLFIKFPKPQLFIKHFMDLKLYSRSITVSSSISNLLTSSGSLSYISCFIIYNCPYFKLLFPLPTTYLLLFHVCTTSGSVRLWRSAWASRKSKRYLTAGGRLLFTDRIVPNKSSTNFCNVPCKNEKETQNQQMLS